MTAFVYEALPGRILFGAGVARARLEEELAAIGAQRVLLIVTGRSEALAKELVEPFAERISGTFTDVRPHVPVETANAARAVATECGAQAVLSIGGGSTTGTAKAVAMTTGLPIVAVPTTYAGSEVTPVWGLTEGHRKTTGRDVAVLPRTVLYDPELTVTLPPDLSASSGMNALAHCLEAFWAPGANPVTSLAAEDGIRALARGLPGIVADPRDLSARSDALYGAYLAGAAFAVAGSSVHHKICHVLGGAYELPHAPTHAVVLPHVLLLMAPALPDVEARIAQALGSSPGGAVSALVALSRRLGAPATLREVGLREDDLEHAADLVLEKLPADGPVPLGRAAVAALLDGAWRGAPQEQS